MSFAEVFCFLANFDGKSRSGLSVVVEHEHVLCTLNNAIISY